LKVYQRNSIFKILKIKYLILILVLGLFCPVRAQTADSLLPVKVVADTVFIPVTVDSSLTVHEAVLPGKKKESRRIVAVVLCITLGPFGMHRLYLGTEPQVPAAYTVTLGGGFGFVTIIDLLHLVFAKDISPYRNNPHFIMWKKY
jgi:hypothetical protein